MKLRHDTGQALEITPTHSSESPAKAELPKSGFDSAARTATTVKFIPNVLSQSHVCFGEYRVRQSLEHLEVKDITQGPIDEIILQTVVFEPATFKLSHTLPPERCGSSNCFSLWHVRGQYM